MDEVEPDSEHLSDGEASSHKAELGRRCLISRYTSDGEAGSPVGVVVGGADA